MTHWLTEYRRSWLRGDLTAGITVGIMLIPQGMAYAMIAGLPPIYGLYAATLPLLVYALLGSSRQLAVGPTALSALLTAAGIGAITTADGTGYIAIAIATTLCMGLIQLGMGVFRLGFLVSFLSRPVIAGFTSAAALIIGLSQLKHLIGVDLARSRYVHRVLGEAFGQIGQWHWPTLLVGALGMVLLAVGRRWARRLPGPLVVVVLGTLAAWGFDLAAKGVSVVQTVPPGLPSFQIPAVSSDLLWQLLPIASTLALVSFMESIALAKAMQTTKKDPPVRPNQELIAIGLSNVFGSFFQSQPVTGGLSRTAVNHQAGANSQLAGIISASVVAVSLLFFTPLFYYLPHAVLASIIMVAVAGLIDWTTARQLWRTDRSDFWMMMATFWGTLLLGIEQGILIGLLLSIGVIIYRTARPHFAVLGKIPGQHLYKNVSRFEELEERADVLIMRFDARLYYANADYFQANILTQMDQKGATLRLFVLDANSINGIDSTGVKTLEYILEHCQASDVLFYMSNVKGPLRDKLRRSGFDKKLGEHHFFMHVQNAVDTFDGKSPQRFEEYVLQHNK